MVSSLQTSPTHSLTVSIEGELFPKGTTLEIHHKRVGPSSHAKVYPGTLLMNDGSKQSVVVKKEYRSAPDEAHGIEEEHKNAKFLEIKINSSSLSPEQKAFMLSKFCFPIYYSKDGDSSSGIGAFMVFPHGGVNFLKAQYQNTVPVSVFLSAYKQIGIVLTLLHEIDMAYGDINSMNALINEDGKLVFVDLATVSERPREFLSWYQKEDVLKWINMMPYILEDNFPCLRDAKERFFGKDASIAKDARQASETMNPEDLLGLFMDLLDDCCNSQKNN